MPSLLSSIVLAVAVLAAPAAPALAQAWPSKPVHLVVPFAPGGGNDILARTLGAKLQARLGQPFVVENRQGAGGNIGAEFVVRASPDGHTLLLANNTLTISPSITRKMPFEVRQDFAPVVLFASTPFLLVVNPALPVKSVGELIAYAKANPGKLSYASVGAGTPHHLGMELFKSMTGVDMVHVPYKGSVPALTDVASGQVPLMFATINAALPFVQGGRLRAIATGESQRLSTMRDLPTVSEAGVAGFELSAWYAFLAPAKTPEDIVNRLSQEVLKSLAEPDVKERLQLAGFEITPGPASQLKALIQSDLDKWARIVKSADIQPE